MQLFPLTQLKEWYDVGLAYDGFMLPLLIWTVITFILLLALTAYFVRIGRTPTLFSRPFGFTAGLTLLWATHAFILYLAYVQIESYDNIWGGHFMSALEFTRSRMTIHRAAVGMTLSSTLFLLLATCILLRGSSQDLRTA